jgi:hypothetical protein
MTSNSIIYLTINLADSSLDPEELDEETHKLMKELRELDVVEQVNFVNNPETPVGSKPGISTLMGLLTVEVSLTNIKSLFGFLGDRFGDKTIEMEVEANGKKLKVKASSKYELSEAIKAAQDFIKS